MKNIEKDSGKLQWVFFVIIIPILFTVTFIVVILSVAGIDVLGKLKETISHIPGTAEILNEDEKQTETAPADDQTKMLKEENKQQKSTIEKQDLDISALENDADLKEKEIQKLSQEVKSLKDQLQLTNEPTEVTEEEGKDIAKLYENMSSKKAAEIIPLLTDEEAGLILSKIKDDQVVAILEKMPAEDAARYTKMLADS